MIDLHIHSNYSDDGEITPEKLVEMCKKQKIQMVSVTDHNCVKANKSAQKAAKEVGILYVPGIEIDCVYQGVNFHVLGYGIDFESEDFQKIENDVREQGLETSRIRLEKTREMGFEIEESEMWEITKDNTWQGMWMGEVFAEVLLAKPEYENHPILQPYRPGGSRSDNPMVNFYWDYYSQGKLCYAEIKFPPMQSVIDIIHRNHGIAILAHPGVNLKGHEELFDSIVEMGIDGVECFSSYHTTEISDYYYQKTLEKGLLYTCGSDFHGKNKPAVVLGGATYGKNMDKEIYSEKICEKMKKLIEEKKKKLLTI